MDNECFVSKHTGECWLFLRLSYEMGKGWGFLVTFPDGRFEIVEISTLGMADMRKRPDLVQVV